MTARELGYEDAKNGEVPLFENSPAYMDGYAQGKAEESVSSDVILDTNVF